MADSRIAVVAKLKAKPGRENETRATLLGMVAPSRADKGCIRYDLHQGTDDPATFLFIETWASRADLEAHLAMPHVQDPLSRSDELLAAPTEVTVARMISSPAE